MPIVFYGIEVTDEPSDPDVGVTLPLVLSEDGKAILAEDNEPIFEEG